MKKIKFVKIMSLALSLLLSVSLFSFGCNNTEDTDPTFTNPYENSTTQFDFYGYSGPSNGKWYWNGETYYAGEDFRTVERYKEYKDCGMTICFPQDSAPIDYEAQTNWESSKTKQVLDNIYEAGFAEKTIIQDGRIQTYSKYTGILVGKDGYFQTYEALKAEIKSYISLYCNHPAVGGVMLGDEPYYTVAENYAMVYRAIKEAWYDATNGKDCYVQFNLNPIGSAASEKPICPPLTEEEEALCETYEDQIALRYKKYLECFMEAIQNEFAKSDYNLNLEYCQYDDYPLYSSSVKPYFILGLQVCAEVCKEYGIDFNMVVQTMNLNGNQRHLSLDDMYFLNNIAVGFGIKNISYFTYWTKAVNYTTTGGEWFNDGDSFITRYGEKTDIYDNMKTIMAEEQQLAKTIGNFTYRTSKTIKCTTSEVLHYTGYDYVNNSIATYKTGKIFNVDNFKVISNITLNREYALITELYDSNKDNYMYMIQNVSDPLHKGALTYETVTVNVSGYSKAIIFNKGVASKGFIRNGQMTFNLDAGQATYVLFYK